MAAATLILVLGDQLSLSRGPLRNSDPASDTILVPKRSKHGTVHHVVVKNVEPLSAADN